MASRLMPICGHLRTIGEERVVHVCIRQRDHQVDDGTNHLLIPWTQYVQQRAQKAEEDPDFEARPWWVEALAEAVHEMNRQAFRDAVEQERTERERHASRKPPRPDPPNEDDPDHVKESRWRAREEWDRTFGQTERECQTTRRIPPHAAPGTPTTVQQCGNPVRSGELHNHGNWRDLPTPDVVPTMGGDPDLQPGYVPPGSPPAHPDGEEQTGQCQATRRDPADHSDEGHLQQCGRPMGHPEDDRPTLGGHDEWVDLPHGGGPAGGRPDTEEWKNVHRDDPDAWKAPDDGDRATQPPAGGPVPEDVGGTQLSPEGRKRGQGSKEIKFVPPARGEGGRPVVSVGEVKAVAARMKDEFQELMGQADQARNIVNRLGGEAANLLAESSQETGLDDVIANLGLAIENLERFISSA